MLLAGSIPCQASRIKMLDGRVVEATVSSLEDGHVQFSNNRVNLSQVRRITLGKTLPPSNVRGGTKVLFRSGGEVRVAECDIQESQCHFRPVSGKRAVSVAVNEIEAIVMQHHEGLSRQKLWQDSLAQKERSKDRLLVRKGDTIIALDGALESLNETSLQLMYKGKLRKMNINKVVAVILASGKRPDLTKGCSVRHQDGSLWVFADIRKDGRVLQGKLIGGSSVKLYWKDLASLEFFNRDQFVYLSELEPAKVSEGGGFTFKGWQKDRSVMRKPLQLGEEKFDRGIGCHAPCALSYQLDDRFSRFVAVVGIDAATRGRGDAVFSVLADGKKLFEKRLMGGEKPARISLPVSGVRSLELRVDAGEGFDLGDHADWADAILVRKGVALPDAVKSGNE